MKVLAIIVLIIIFPLFFLAIFGLSLKWTVQNPGFLKTELKNQNAYVKINKGIPEIVSMMQENPSDTGEAPVLSKEELATFLQGTLTSDVLEEMVDDMLSGKKGSSIARNGIPLNDGVTNILKKKFDTVPECTSVEMASGGELSCRPPGMTFDQLLAQLPTQAGNNPLFSANGTSETASPESPQPPQSQSGPSLSSLSAISKFTNMTYILPIILIFIVFFLARGYAGSWLGSGKIFGIFLAVLSVLSLLTSFLLSLFNKPIASFVSGFANNMPKLKAELIVPLLNDILGKISQMTNKTSIVSASVGIVLFIVFLIITKIKKKNQPVLAET